MGTSNIDGARFVFSFLVGFVIHCIRVVTAGFAINAGFDIKLVIEKIETTLEHCAHVPGMEATETEEYLCTGFNNALRLAQDTPDASSGNGATEHASKCVREITEAASTRCAETQSAIRQWAEIGAEACTRLAQMMAPDRPDETHGQPEPECDHAPARGTLVALLKRGLGLCVEHVCNLDPSVVNAIEQVVKAAADQDKTALATHDVSTIPFGVSAAAVLANLLQLTEVQSVGAVPMRALQSNSISEVNITGQGQVGACEASLLGYYFDCNSKFDRIVLNEKYTLATANCNESVWDCKAKGLGPAQVMVLAATLSTNSASGVEEVDISENPISAPLYKEKFHGKPGTKARNGGVDYDTDVSGIEALSGIKVKSLAMHDCELGPKAITALSSTLSNAVVEAVDLSDNRFDPALMAEVKDKVKLTMDNCSP